MEIEMAIEIKELYTSFDTINPRQVNSILNGVCGAYSTIIKPINKELKDPQNAASIEIGTDNQVDTTTRISIVLRLTLWDKLFYNTNFSFDVNGVMPSTPDLAKISNNADLIASPLVSI